MVEDRGSQYTTAIKSMKWKVHCNVSLQKVGGDW